MGFSVDVVALDGLARALERRERDMDSGRAYLHRYTRLSYGPGLLNLITGGHHRVVGEVDRFLRDTGAATAAGYATRIRRAIVAYRRTDLAAAARYDATLPGAAPPVSGAGRSDVGRRGGAGHPGGSGGTGHPDSPAGTAARAGTVVPARPSGGEDVFADHLRPADDYRPPPDRHDRFPYRPRWGDLVSPASFARDAIWDVTVLAAQLGLLDRPVDPYEALVAPLCGDWAGLYACGDVMDALAAAVAGCARAIGDSRAATGRVWTGQAAGGCVQGLGRFSGTLVSGAGTLHAIGAMYRTVAEGVHANGQLLGEVVTMLIDEAIGTAGTAGTSGTLAPVATVARVRDVVATVRRAIGLISAIEQVVRDGEAALTSAGHRFGVIDAGLRLPAPATAFPSLPQPAMVRYA